MPAAEGCSSVWEFDDEPPLDWEDEDASALLIEVSNLMACGTSKSVIDFKQNLRASRRLPASKCFCAIVRLRSASSLFPSIVYRQFRKYPVSTNAVERDDLVVGVDRGRGDSLNYYLFIVLAVLRADLADRFGLYPGNDSISQCQHPPRQRKL